MAGLVPAIHGSGSQSHWSFGISARLNDVDARHEAGHDGQS